MKCKSIPVFFAVAVLSMCAAGTAHAEFLGKFGAWETFVRMDGKVKVCYAATTPTKSEGKYNKRGDVFLLVSHRPADKMLGFVSLEAGYPYKKNGKVTAEIGGTAFPMYADGQLSFAYDDKALVAAMIKGADITIQGRSSRGTLTTDRFSLSGFTAAYRAASKACGVEG